MHNHRSRRHGRPVRRPHGPPRARRLRHRARLRRPVPPPRPALGSVRSIDAIGQAEAPRGPEFGLDARHDPGDDRGVGPEGRAGEVLRRRRARGFRAEPRRVRGFDLLRDGRKRPSRARSERRRIRGHQRRAHQAAEVRDGKVGELPSERHGRRGRARARRGLRRVDDGARFRRGGSVDESGNRRGRSLRDAPHGRRARGMHRAARHGADHASGWSRWGAGAPRRARRAARGHHGPTRQVSRRGDADRQRHLVSADRSMGRGGGWDGTGKGTRGAVRVGAARGVAGGL
mmetsp:Transcript_5315/g.19989  ORF Transcript_5315/g.19989 Transcript_5315/m.19989 type:complete len:288 (-) Transcript_5315:191-1054(-)